MSDSTVSHVLHLSQIPAPSSLENLPATAVRIDVTSAATRQENDSNDRDILRKIFREETVSFVYC